MDTLKDHELDHIRLFLGGGGRYIDTVSANDLTMWGMHPQTFMNLIELGYITVPTLNLFALTLKGIEQATKFMKPAEVALKLGPSKALDNLLPILPPRTAFTLCNALVELEKAKFSPRFYCETVGNQTTAVLTLFIDH